jgi:hypothetical protein
MEVIRRLKLPDAKSVIPKFGSSQGNVNKDRAVARTSTHDENRVESLKEAEGVENKHLLPKKARGKQPIAPKPDESVDVMGRKITQPSKNMRTPSSAARSHPRASQGRVQKPHGRRNMRKGTQDPPGDVNRNASVVAAHMNVSAVPDPSSPSPQAKRDAAPKGRQSNRLGAKRPKQDERPGQDKSDSQPQIPDQTNNDKGAPSEPQSMNGPHSIPLSNPSTVQSSPVMLRRPTPATFLFKFPSRSDSPRAAALSSLFGDEGGLIGELEGQEEMTKENEAGGAAIAAEELHNVEAPRIQSSPAMIDKASNDSDKVLSLYPTHNSATSLDLTAIVTPASQDDSRSRVSSGPARSTGEDDVSLPIQSYSLQASMEASGISRPEDSTTSLGRHSTTTSTIRRRGRSHSRTRQNSSNSANPFPSIITTTTAPANSGPNAPQRRSRSRCRRSRSQSRRRARSASGAADAVTPGPVANTHASEAAGGNISQSGRRGRAPPVTKRTPAQKMSIRHAVRAADLDMVTTLALVAGSDGTPASPSSPRSTTVSLARFTDPSSPSRISVPVANLAGSTNGDCDVAGIQFASTPSCPPFATGEGGHEVDHVPASPIPNDSAAVGPTQDPPKNKNPVKLFTQGLLKRRQSLTGKSP